MASEEPCKPPFSLSSTAPPSPQSPSPSPIRHILCVTASCPLAVPVARPHRSVRERGSGGPDFIHALKVLGESHLASTKAATANFNTGWQKLCCLYCLNRMLSTMPLQRLPIEILLQQQPACANLAKTRGAIQGPTSRKPPRKAAPKMLLGQ